LNVTMIWTHKKYQSVGTKSDKGNHTKRSRCRLARKEIT
jgi:hypothetical protein